MPIKCNSSAEEESIFSHFADWVKFLVANNYLCHVFILHLYTLSKRGFEITQVTNFTTSLSREIDGNKNLIIPAIKYNNSTFTGIMQMRAQGAGNG